MAKTAGKDAGGWTSIQAVSDLRTWCYRMGAVALAMLAFAAQSPIAHAGATEFCVTCTGPEASYRCTFAGEPGNGLSAGLQLHCISTLAREGHHQSCAVSRATQTPCGGALKVLALPEVSPGSPSLPAGSAAGGATGGVPADALPQAAVPPSAGTTSGSTVRAPLQNGPLSDDVEAQAGRNAAPFSPGQPAARSAPQPAATATAGGAQPAVTRPKEAAVAPAAPPAGARPPSMGNAVGSPAPEKQPLAPAKPDDEQQKQAQSTQPLDEAGKAVDDAAKSTGAALSKAGDAVGAAAKKSWNCLTSLFGDC